VRDQPARIGSPAQCERFPANSKGQNQQHQYDGPHQPRQRRLGECVTGDVPDDSERQDGAGGINAGRGRSGKVDGRPDEKGLHQAAIRAVEERHDREEEQQKIWTDVVPRQQRRQDGICRNGEVTGQEEEGPDHGDARRKLSVCIGE
jgi:hypothetical protein